MFNTLDSLRALASWASWSRRLATHLGRGSHSRTPSILPKYSWKASLPLNQVMFVCAVSVSVPPRDVCMRFPNVASVSVRQPPDLELGYPIPLAPSHYAAHPVLGLSRARDTYWECRSAPPGLV